MATDHFKKDTKLIFSLCVLFAFISSGLFARTPYRRNFLNAYKSANNTRLATLTSNSKHCGVCHYDFDGGGPKNPYGVAVEATDRSVEAILGLDGLDSDGDGFTNGTEITDKDNYSNTPTFPGLTPTNLSQTVNVNIAEIQLHLVPSAGADSTPPQVKVITPDGGEVLTGNSSTTIEWLAEDESGISSVDVYLSLDGGVTYKPELLGIANTGSHTWFPANRPSETALIKIFATDNSFNKGMDESDNTFTIVSPVGGLAPTTLRDFDQPGSQPFEAGVLNPPQACEVCHGNYDKNVEPQHNWKGSMMAQASIDPIFLANMTIANQDAPDSGDLCLRCHFPRGWLQGRSVPTDGSAMLEADKSGVSCDLCHRLVDPIFNEQQNPAEDENILASLEIAPLDYANGMFVVDPGGTRRGPFSDADSGHPVLVSPFHREAALCGTCHDVNNPAFEKDDEGNYVPNEFDAPASSYSSNKILPVERTFSEWLNSAYNSPEGVYDPVLGGNKTFVSTCQDCHMKDVTGYGCNFGNPPLRDDLPLHDMTGGSTWLAGLIGQIHPDIVDEEAMQDGIARARKMLRNAAKLEAEQQENKLEVTVTNHTGHKLPTGYPEGRRIWINVKFYDESMNLLSESCEYDSITGELKHDEEAKIYEVKPGLDSVTAPLTGDNEGPSFHFVLNNKVFKDNRIPPIGFTNSAYEDFGGAPVEYSYEDGQYWDSSYYSIPKNSASAKITLYYQSTSKEFIEFLRDENKTDTLGQEIYDLWNENGKCPPEEMASIQVTITPPPTPGDFNKDGVVDSQDLVIFYEAWLATPADSNWNMACNLEDSDNIINLKDLAIFSLDWK